jgi:hypothetical protein
MPLVRRRRPLLRAAVAGAAGTAAYKAGQRSADRRQYEGGGEQMAAAEPAPAAPPPASPATAGGMGAAGMEQLKELAQLRDQGILTEEEFQEQKRLILAGGR